MKSLVLSLVMVSLAMFFGVIGQTTQVKDDSLVIYLPVDEGSGDKIKDASMYGNNGTLEGLGDKPQWRDGRYGKALEFTIGGQNSWVEIPHSDSLGITGKGITMMAWVMNKGQTTWGRVMGKNHPYLLYMGADDSLGGYVRGVVDFHSNAIPVTRNEWVHVAGVHDGSELRLYVNGELAATTPAVGDIPEGSEALTIGDAIGDQWLHNRPFIGLIDEVRIYSRVLSADEIKEAMEPIELAVQPSGKVTTFWGKIKSN